MLVSGNSLCKDTEPTNITLSFALTLVMSGRMKTKGGSPGKKRIKTAVDADRGIGPLVVVILSENRYEVSGSRVLIGTIN